jgi:hypothetical protein
MLLTTPSTSAYPPLQFLTLDLMTPLEVQMLSKAIQGEGKEAH